MAAKKYTKADIVDSLYEKTGMNRKDVRILVDLFIDEIKETLTHHSVIEFRGFGTFAVKIRKGRTRARNPKTGETVEVTSHGIASFRPGRELKQAVWNIGPAAGDGLSPPPASEKGDSSLGGVLPGNNEPRS
jgi:integration host factor subunit beta